MYIDGNHSQLETPRVSPVTQEAVLSSICSVSTYTNRRYFAAAKRYGLLKRMVLVLVRQKRRHFAVVIRGRASQKCAVRRQRQRRCRDQFLHSAAAEGAESPRCLNFQAEKRASTVQRCYHAGTRAAAQQQPAWPSFRRRAPLSKPYLHLVHLLGLPMC